jgi:hypothetical protein
MCAFFAYGVVAVMGEIEKRREVKGELMNDESYDERAEPAMRAMQAALTMRTDRTTEAVARLDWGQLLTLQHAAELLGEQVSHEIIRRKSR